MRFVTAIWWALIMSVCCVGAAMIPVSFLYVLVKGSWLVIKHVWLAPW